MYEKLSDITFFRSSYEDAWNEVGRKGCEVHAKERDREKEKKMKKLNVWIIEISMLYQTVVSSNVKWEISFTFIVGGYIALRRSCCCCVFHHFRSIRSPGCQHWAQFFLFQFPQISYLFFFLNFNYLWIIHRHFKIELFSHFLLLLFLYFPCSLTHSLTVEKIEKIGSKKHRKFQNVQSLRA